MTVCRASLTWSTIGILSATISMASRTARISSVQPLVSQCQLCGSSIRWLYRASSPTDSNGIQALSPADAARPAPVSASNTGTAWHRRATSAVE